MRRGTMVKCVRWCAGVSDWHPLPVRMILLEFVGSDWFITFLKDGERHACIGCETEHEAYAEIEWLKAQCPLKDLPWARC